MRLTLLPLCITALAASAQPVVQYGNIVPNGTSFPLHFVSDAGSSDPSADGANVTWNFSSATLQMNVGTMTWANPAETPYGANYPASNKAQVVTLPTGTSYSYFSAQPGQLEQLADGIGGSSPSTFSDPKTLLIFPFNYQASFVDSYNSGTPASVTRAYTGYGTVILPSGTYTNVVKITSSNGGILFLTTNPLAELVNIDSDGTVIVYGDPVSGVGEQATAAELQAWPNPAAGALTISGIQRKGIWELVDAEGRMQRQGSAMPGVLTLPMEGLAPGCYTLVLRDDMRNRALHVVKQ